MEHGHAMFVMYVGCNCILKFKLNSSRIIMVEGLSLCIVKSGR